MPLVVDRDVFPVDVRDLEPKLADDLGRRRGSRRAGGGFPESLCTQKIPGCRRLLTIPDASGTSRTSNLPTGSSGDGPVRRAQQERQD